MTYTTNPRNVLPNGLTLLQQNPDCAARLDPSAKDRLSGFPCGFLHCAL